MLAGVERQLEGQLAGLVRHHRLERGDERAGVGGDVALPVPLVGAAVPREDRVDASTDVLSFGVDEQQRSLGPRELGDIVICPGRTADLREAVVHGALHLSGMDHESDQGEMLALQAELMRCVS